MRFICDFIIESDEQRQTIDYKFYIDNVLSILLTTADLQQVPEIKYSLPKLINIAIADFDTDTLLQALSQASAEEYADWMDEQF